jgi:hypothetical protein
MRRRNPAKIRRRVPSEGLGLWGEQRHRTHPKRGRPIGIGNRPFPIPSETTYAQKCGRGARWKTLWENWRTGLTAPPAFRYYRRMRVRIDLLELADLRDRAEQACERTRELINESQRINVLLGKQFDRPRNTKGSTTAP